jgi:hypothetical protein
MQLLREKGGGFDLDAFLSRPILAHLSTSSAVGGRASVFWFLWEESAVWMIVELGYNTAQERVIVEPRVALAFAELDVVQGTMTHVGMRGVASVEPWEDGRAARLHDRYYRFLPGYVAQPLRPGDRVTGRLPMKWLRVLPESVVLRSWHYRDDVVPPVQP